MFAVNEEMAGPSDFGGATQPDQNEGTAPVRVPEAIPDSWKGFYLELLKRRLGKYSYETLTEDEAHSQALFANGDQNLNLGVADVFVKRLGFHVPHFNVGYRVYNLQPRANKILGPLKSKILHTAITITHPFVPSLGLEIWYGGIIFVDPLNDDPHWLPAFKNLAYKDVPLGTVSPLMFSGALKKLSDTWGDDSNYHVLTNNCNHFASEFIDRLRNEFRAEVDPLPKRCLRSTRFGKRIYEKYPRLGSWFDDAMQRADNPTNAVNRLTDDA